MATLTAAPVGPRPASPPRIATSAAAPDPYTAIPWRAVSVIDAAGLVGMSKQVIYDAINAGELRARKVRSVTRVDIHDLRDWFHDQPEVDN